MRRQVRTVQISQSFKCGFCLTSLPLFQGACGVAEGDKVVVIVCFLFVVSGNRSLAQPVARSLTAVRTQRTDAVAETKLDHPVALACRPVCIEKAC